MKIQFAMDVRTTAEALSLCEQVAEYVDILEVGSPLIVSEGVHAVKAVKDAYPDKIVMADTKCCDGGYMIGSYAYDAGADIATLMAVATDMTVQRFVEAAQEHNAKVLVDILNLDNIEERSRELLDLGVDYVGMHASADTVRLNEVALTRIKRMLDVVPRKQAVVANCLTWNNIEKVLALKPEIVIVSGPIMSAENKREAAKKVRALFDRYNAM